MTKRGGDPASSKDRMTVMLGAAAVCALLVVPVAIAGQDGPSASSSASATSQVKKLKKKVSALAGRVATLEGKPAPSSPTPGGAASLNLPLPSFVSTSTTALYLPLGPEDAGATPDFSSLGGQLQLVYDDDADGGGGDLADTDFVSTTFTVPADYSSGGVLAARASKDGDTGNNERITCRLNRNGAFLAFSHATITEATSSSYVVTPAAPHTLAAGDTVTASCVVDDGIVVGGPAYNNYVRFESFEFRYTATH